METSPPLTVTWLDGGTTAKCRPDPRYPLGVDLDASAGAKEACRTPLPYPAPRCGRHLVRCALCRRSAVVTAAGRTDDPRSVRIACNVRSRDAAGVA